MPICTVFIGALFCKITKPSEFTANEQSEFDEPSARAPFAVGDTTASTQGSRKVRQTFWERGGATQRLSFRIYAETI